MKLSEMIFCRKSVRSYENKTVDVDTVQKIKEFAIKAKALYPDIKFRMEIVKRENIKCICPWVTPQVIVVYSEEKEGMFENVGFIFQQLDLYIQSLGLGVCWLGMGRMKNQYVVEDRNGSMKFVIMLAFGYPDGRARRTDVKEFRRRALAEISDISDDKLEPARLAPSSVNSQPWYFVHDGKAIHTYCIKQGFLKAKMLRDMNRIDIGICLAHMYVANPETFSFFEAEDPGELKGYEYIGSFTI